DPQATLFIQLLLLPLRVYGLRRVNNHDASESVDCSLHLSDTIMADVYIDVHVVLRSFSRLFFQAEDGIRDRNVTGVQTCALPIWKYFTVNRARQYGKTTVLTALAEYLKAEYSVISLDFQMISYADFESEQSFVAAFSRELLDCAGKMPASVESKLKLYSTGKVHEATLSVLFKTLAELCAKSEKKIVLIIDEIDTASNNQVFIDFLAQ